MSSLDLFTIGFTRKTAEEFFTKLAEAGVRRVIDVRLNNSSQLAGFTKKDDLAYFLRAINHIDYVHVPVLAPTQELLDAFKKGHGNWEDYERGFLALMEERRVHETVSRELFDHGCLLCSEAAPRHCHRRLVAEYLQSRWGEVAVRHLV